MNAAKLYTSSFNTYPYDYRVRRNHVYDKYSDRSFTTTKHIPLTNIGVDNVVEMRDDKFYVFLNTVIKSVRHDPNMPYSTIFIINLLYMQDIIPIEKNPEYSTPAGSLVVSTDHGLFFSVDSGETWFLQGVSQYGLMNKSVHAADVKWQLYDVHDDPSLVGKPYGVIALSTDRGVFYSNDGGQTWLRDTTGIMNNSTNLDI